MNKNLIIVQFFRQTQQICPDFGLLRRIAQQIGGVETRQHRTGVAF